jgi:Uma2 family endonuclease
MNQHVATERRPATYQDVIDAPPNMVAELIDGALHLQPRPRYRHARASSALGVEIGGPFDKGSSGPGGWWILDEPELHFGQQVLVPDLAGWRRERMPAIADVPWSELAPDWACEIISSSTRAIDLTAKRRIYGEAGVGHLWLVDPETRTLEAFTLRDGAWALVAALKDEDEVRVPPFDAIAFPLSVLWPD